MAAKPKLSQEQWAEVRAKWEKDTREGYAWLIEELNLPVSATAARKTAIKEGWMKISSRRAHTSKFSETMTETIEQATHKEKKSCRSGKLNEFGGLNQLTDKQEIFVREYVVDWNAKQAAIRAGYSEKSAAEQASRLLINVNVQNAIAALTKDRAQRLEIDADELLNAWASVVSFDSNEISQLQAQATKPRLPRVLG